MPVRGRKITERHCKRTAFYSTCFPKIFLYETNRLPKPKITIINFEMLVLIEMVAQFFSSHAYLLPVPDDDLLKLSKPKHVAKLIPVFSK